MDLESLLQQNRRSLLKDESSMTPRERRAHDQFAREYAEQTLLTRAALMGTSK